MKRLLGVLYFVLALACLISWQILLDREIKEHKCEQHLKDTTITVKDTLK